MAHAYCSTACAHRLHERCRRTCKFCLAACSCSCHRSELPDAPESTLYGSLTAHPSGHVAPPPYDQDRTERGSP